MGQRSFMLQYCNWLIRGALWIQSIRQQLASAGLGQSMSVMQPTCLLPFTTQISQIWLMRSHTLKVGDGNTIPWEGLWRVFRMFIKPSRNPGLRQTALQTLICRTGWRWCRIRLSPGPTINYSYYWLAKQCHFHALGDHGGATFTCRDDPTNPDQLCRSTSPTV